MPYSRPLHKMAVKGAQKTQEITLRLTVRWGASYDSMILHVSNLTESARSESVMSNRTGLS